MVAIALIVGLLILNICILLIVGSLKNEIREIEYYDQLSDTRIFSDVKRWIPNMKRKIESIYASISGNHDRSLVYPTIISAAIKS